MKKLLIATAALLAISCDADPIRKVPSGNPSPNVEVHVMAEFDGIVLYKVYTGGEHVWVAAAGKNLQTQWSEQEGKITVTRRAITAEK